MKPTQHTNLIILVFSLILIVVCVLTLIIRDIVVGKSANYPHNIRSSKPSAPQSTNIPQSSPSIYPAYPAPKPDPTVFNPVHASIYSFLIGDKLYYIKEGNIVRAFLRDLKAIPVETVVDVKEDILAFDVSPDENYIVYSVRLNASSDDTIFSEANGDNIVIRDLKKVTDLYVYSDSKGENMEVRDIKFSKDSKKLFFTGNSIWSYDLQTKALKKFLTKEKNGFCSIYFINDASWDNRYLLVRNGCYEGGLQIVFDLFTEKTVGSFENGYVGGGVWGLGFLSDSLLLGYDDINYSRSHYNGEKVENDKIVLSSYSPSGKVSKKIFELNKYPRFMVKANEFDTDTKGNTFYLLTTSGEGLDSNNQTFELNSDTFTLTLSNIEKHLVVVDSYYSDKVSTYAIFITGPHLENPVLVDTLSSAVSASVKLETR